MIGLGTLVNSAAIVLGGMAGLFFGNLLKERVQDTLNMACGVSVLFIGIAGAMEGMLSIDGGLITSGRAMPVVICLALGALVGEWLDLDRRFEDLGRWLRENRKRPGYRICKRLRHRLADRMHRRNGNRRRDRRRTDRRLVNPRYQGRSRPYHRHGHDLLARKRVHLFRSSGFCL